MKRSLTAAALFFALFISGCSSPSVSKAEYDQLTIGMSLSQVQSIVGSPGTEAGRTERPGLSLVTQGWENDNGAKMVCVFQDGALVSRTQVGLD